VINDKLNYKMKNNILRDKTLKFAIRIVNLYKYLITEKKEFIMSKQLLKSGTSIGANCREGDYAESKLDFIHKFGISQKECSETMYWLEILLATNYISEEQYKSIYTDNIEIMKIITSSILTAKKKINDK